MTLSVKMKKEKTLTIPSDIKNLNKVRRFIEDVTNGSHFNESQVFDIKVAVSEAVSNAIEHGSPGGSEDQVKINASYNENTIELKVVDQGIFKARMPVDDPTFPNHRGRGIAFMLALMDEVNISESKVGTTVKLLKKAS